ncbi:MAG: gliding motility-associated C-terminal domain-containing protein [Bacteroidia bacterium]|nr:gliding motility-associated C-terminal domain-containing protein [Bacteroidia bacterium]
MRIILFIKISLIALLFFTSKLHAQGGDNATAAAASPITLPFSASGTTCGHVNNYNPLSPYGITPDGRDWLYYFCAPSSGAVDIFMTNAYGLAPAIMVYSTIPNAGGSNWFATSFTGGQFINSLVTVTVTAGTCYYVMIDNFPAGADNLENCFSYTATIKYHTNPPVAPLEPACSNIGYDAGGLAGWVGTYGAVKTGTLGATTPEYFPLYYTTSAQQHSVTSGAGVDPYGGFPIVNPTGGTNSLRLGDMGNFGTGIPQNFGGIPGAGGATLEQKFTVTPSNALFVYYYAVVIQNALSDSILLGSDGLDSLDIFGNIVPATDAFGNNILVPHKAVEQPFFKTDVIDCSGNLVACGQYLVKGGPNIPGFSVAPGTTDVYYKTWSPVAVDLTPFIGTCVTVRYTVGDCTVGGHFAYAYIDATCSPLAITGINKVCPTKSTVLSAPVGLFTYSWTPGGATSQTVAVTPTTTTTYTCQLTSYANCQTFLTYSVSLYPAAIASTNSQTVCNGTAALLTSTVNNGAGTYSWSPGGGAGSSLSPSPSSTTVYTVTYTDVNGCQDTALGRVTVNPLPSMQTPSNVIVCHNGIVPASAFSSTVVGTTFSWTNSNTLIGLPSNGSSDTPSFTAVNSGVSPVNAVVSVTPTANSCVGPPITYTIIVNPIPNVNVVPSATYCAGVTVPSTSFSGSVTSTTYSWSNTNSNIGLGTSGTGNIASYGATNASASGISGVITVTPSANTCVGIPTNFTVNVNPIPTVNAVPSATYCSGVSVSAVSFTGNATGTTFSWANSNTSIGAPSSGLGTVGSFNASNNSTSGISGIITVTPSASSCTGTPTSYTIVVNPIPNVTAVPSATYCAGATVPTTNFTGSVTSTTYSWSNTNSAIGLGTSGIGNISSYSATNTSASGISGVITVTPSANSCLGTPTNFTILVNPIPNVNAMPSATYCAGDAVPITNLTGSVTSTTFNWTNTNTSIGLGASGSGNVASYTSANNTSAGILGVITITPSANSCTGTPTNYTVVVNPIPNVTAIPNATYCAGVAVPATNLTSSVTSTTFNWTNSNSSIGLGTSGVGNISSYTSVNNTATGILGVITITPSANSCVGTPINYTVLVNPIPTVNAIPSSTACSGGTIAAAGFNGNVTGTTFNWSNSNSSIGLGASGLGNIPSFTSSNTGAVSVNAVVTVTPSANSCIGTPGNYTITVNPNPLAPTVANATICPSSSATLTATAPGATYNWFDNIGGALLGTNPTYNTPALNITTTYYVNTTNAFGCVSPYTTVVANVLNFLAVSASPNQTICVGANATLSVSPTTAGNIYSWDSPGNLGFANTANTSVSPAITTNYSVTVTSANGCTGISQTQVFVNPLPIASAGNPAVFCNGQSGTIGTGAMAGYSYSWLPTTGLSSSTISNPTVTLPNLGSTPIVNEYTVTASLNGCQASSQVQVVVNPLPVSNAGAPITLCAGQTGTIGAASNPNYSYSWLPAINLSSTSASNPSVNGVNGAVSNTSLSYTVTTTEIATTCQSSVSVIVTVLPLSTVNAGSDVATCEGSSNIQLNGTIGGSANSAVWSGGSGNFSANNMVLNPIYNPSSVDYLSSPLTLTLTAIATAPCQNVTSTVQIVFYKKPVINFTVNYPAGCPEHCVTFTDQSSVNPPDFIQAWDWNFGDGGTSNAQNPAHCYTQSGLYSVTLTAISNHQCSNTLTIPDMVEVYPVPVASFFATPPVGSITDPNISFQNTSQGAVSYIWGFGDQFASGVDNSSTVINPSHAYTNSGDYVVTLIATSIHGCEDRTSIPVKIDPEFTFYIPNCFTPETADGINDIFTGMGIGIEKYEMWVFDRWGEKIYYTDDIHKGWNGKRLGHENIVQQDVYVWKVKLTDVFGKKHDYIGHVTLLK